MRPIAGIIFLVLLGLAQGNHETLDEKVSALQDHFHRHPVMKMNMDRWRNFVRSQPRNYTMFVMFTALSPGVNCPICRPAYDEFVIMANSHRHQNMHLKSVYFGVVDYEDAPQIFQQMNLNTAPILFHFGPKLQGKKKPEKMDFQRHGFGAEEQARFVADNTEVQIRIHRPPNYTFTLVAFLLVFLLFGLLYIKRDSMEFAYNKTTWGLVCLSVVFIFLSGQMWNHIRGPPFLSANPSTKETIFIHKSTQYQFVGETYIVAGLYAVITFGFILLNDAVGEDKSEKKKFGKSSNLFNINANALAYVGIGIVLVFFSALLSVFRSKYGSYPFSLLFY